MIEMPIIKLELQHMRQSMLVALADYNSNITREVEKALDEEINRFDFQAAIMTECRNALTAALKDYFTYGAGSRLIKKATAVALDEAFGIKADTGWLKE